MADTDAEESRSGGAPEPRFRDVLVVAFPSSAALAVPPAATPLGRASLAKVGREDKRVSEEHLKLIRDGSRLLAVDRSTHNTTWIGGKRLAHNKPMELEDGAILRVGNTLLVRRRAFEGPEAPDAPEDGLVGPYGLRKVRAALKRLVESPPLQCDVLIEGDTGTGKELLARTIHERLRPGKALGAINCAVLRPERAEGELFGYVKGAFTGAIRDDDGFILKHQEGTVFLDEFGTLRDDVQSMLLRFLQERNVRPMGGTRGKPVTVLVVGATNARLAGKVAAGTFRRDLLARFTVRFAMPALRDRREDIPAIADALLDKAYPDGHLDADADAMELCMLADFADNVRGLERALIGAHQHAKTAGAREITGAAMKRAFDDIEEQDRANEDDSDPRAAAQPLRRPTLAEAAAAIASSSSLSEAARKLRVGHVWLQRNYPELTAPRQAAWAQKRCR